MVTDGDVVVIACGWLVVVVVVVDVNRLRRGVEVALLLLFSRSTPH